MLEKAVCFMCLYDVLAFLLSAEFSNVLFIGSQVTYRRSSTEKVL